MASKLAAIRFHEVQEVRKYPHLSYNVPYLTFFVARLLAQPIIRSCNNTSDIY